MREWNAIILCPGRSLHAALVGLRTGSVPEPAFIVGINRAVTAWPCDYWCSLDARPYSHIEPLGKPEYIIRWDQIRLLKEGAVSGLACAKVIRKRDDGYPRGVDYYSYSMLAAIAFASTQSGIKNIDIFGADMDGQTDWDGRPNFKSNRRTDDRWSREYMKFQKLCDYLEERNISVQRCFREGYDANPGQ